MTPAPLGMLAELTHRCPLACPYCSNPLDLEHRANELDTGAWTRTFAEAAELGVLHLHLSGGEPLSRHDLVELTDAAAACGLYTNLITSGIGLTRPRLDALVAAGLDHVQLSIQDSDAACGDSIAGYEGAQGRKQSVAQLVVAAGLPLTINVVVHRLNIARIPQMVADAHTAGARRIEVAHAQYYGWAHLNRNALLPTADQVGQAQRDVARLRQELGSSLLIDYVAPDHFARFPKPCMNGWGRQSLNVTPGGRVLPCHAAETIPGLVFWSVRDHPLRDIWEASPAFLAFRGTDWMREPCRSCARREIDFGGCRCQAFALTGEAANTDPACELSPFREKLEQVVSAPRTDKLRHRIATASRAATEGRAPPGR